MAKYGRDNLGREIWREDDNGNKVYNTSYIKKHLGANDDTDGYRSVNYPLQMIMAVGLFLISALFFFLFIYWGITDESITMGGVIFMEIFPVLGFIISILWIKILLC